MKAVRNAMRQARALQSAPREPPALFKCIKKIEARRLESEVIPGPSELIELLVALVSLLTALIELTEALKQHLKHNKSQPLRH